jgi:hypothetical protein
MLIIEFPKNHNRELYLHNKVFILKNREKSRTNRKGGEVAAKE